MRLHRLYLGEYRVLRDLEIEFLPGFDTAEGGPDYALDFLVGLNGSGKSTVLQAITDIFRRLEAGRPIPFAFEMEYELRAQKIRRVIVGNRANTPEGGIKRLPSPWIRIQDEGSSTEETVPWSNDLLPTALIAFTTGSESDWLGRINLDTEEQALDSSTLKELSLEQRAVAEFPFVRSRERTHEGENRHVSASRSTFISNSHLPLVTLCGLLEHLAQQEAQKASGLELVLANCAITRFCGFSLRLHTNEYNTGPEELERIRTLAGYATRSLKRGSELLLVFDLTGEDGKHVPSFLQEFAGSFGLFQLLSRLSGPVGSADSILQQTNIFIERSAGEGDDETPTDSPPLHLFDWLSDGEKNFIGRFCLFALLKQQDSLILLDEPEVHFNDYWKRQIVSFIDALLQTQKSHVLITSHSSVTLSDVPSEDVIFLNRPGAYTTEAGPPSLPTFAADPSDIMVHVFGAPHAAGQRAVDYIQRKLNAPGSPAERREQLERLLERTGPGYWSYRIRRELSALESES